MKTLQIDLNKKLGYIGDFYFTFSSVCEQRFWSFSPEAATDSPNWEQRQ